MPRPGPRDVCIGEYFPTGVVAKEHLPMHSFDLRLVNQSNVCTRKRICASPPELAGR